MFRLSRYVLVAALLIPGLGVGSNAQAQDRPRSRVRPLIERPFFRREPLRIAPRYKLDRELLRFRVQDRIRDRMESARVRQFARGHLLRDRSLMGRERAQLRFRGRSLMPRRPLRWYLRTI